MSDKSVSIVVGLVMVGIPVLYLQFLNWQTRRWWNGKRSIYDWNPEKDT